MHENVSNIAMRDVNSSIILDSDLFVICNEVITNRQNPRRFAEVFKMCWEVVFAIYIKGEL